MKKYNIFLSLFIGYLLINMVLMPKVYINATYSGIKAWALNVLPSVLPFMIFTKLLSNLGMVDKCARFLASPCKKLFNCPSSSAVVFLTSVISGYPVGAAMTADMYQTGKISKSEAFRMCSFCSTSGPMFIVGAVGVSMLGSALYGYIILFSHVLGALLNGLIYKKLKVVDVKSDIRQHIQSQNDLSTVIQNSVLNILSVGAIIAIFFVIITSLSPIFNLFPPQIACILKGIVEITKGCSDIAESLGGIWAVATATFVISFGGISTILQSITLLNKLQMPIKTFVLQKTTHALIAVGISLLTCLILL
ncbi:MAG: hypothetical protein IJY90_01010 [Clostridia bacterium]|nr:hypothetical protein [Clostridia bacterium]